MSKCSFDILNDGDDGLFLYIEPLGAEFIVNPGVAVKIIISGADDPIVMKHWIRPEDQKAAISIWPEKGDFEIIVNGKSVWDLMG
ncbi:hypothetical protein [Roseateles chitinivorans]|uniref:hypothetical protein n=1 Tax=Roseateles chitinivorans TaxID=2917965 RepID=UPI003D675462